MGEETERSSQDGKRYGREEKCGNPSLLCTKLLSHYLTSSPIRLATS